MECIPNRMDEELVWNVFPIGGMKSMECTPKIRDEQYGIYAQN